MLYRLCSPRVLSPFAGSLLSIPPHDHCCILNRSVNPATIIITTTSAGSATTITAIARHSKHRFFSSSSSSFSTFSSRKLLNTDSVHYTTVTRNNTTIPKALASSTATTTGTGASRFQSFSRQPAVPTLHTSQIRKMSASTRMTERLQGKTILITGASSGIGRSTALEFARTAPKDLKLILTARREDALKELAEEIKKEVGTGVRVLPCKLDISDAPAVEQFVASLQGEWRQVNCLVNNAGMVKGDEKSPDIALADIQEMINTNVTGLITMTQAVMKLYRENGPAGSNGQGDVINVGSIAGREGYPGGSIYCATKAAVRTFTDALRKEQIHSLVRVMEIDPGRVETNFSVVRFRGDKDKADAVYANTEPLTPDDIAEIIVFMAGRRDNVVLADAMVYPQHQGSATHVHRKS